MWDRETEGSLAEWLWERTDLLRSTNRFICSQMAKGAGVCKGSALIWGRGG